MRTASFFCISAALHAAALAYPALRSAPEKTTPVVVSIVEGEAGGGGESPSPSARPGDGIRPSQKQLKRASSQNAAPPRAAESVVAEAPKATEPAALAAPAEAVALPVVETQAQSVIGVPIRESAVTVALESGAASSGGIAASGSIAAFDSIGSGGGSGIGSGSGGGSGSGSGGGAGDGSGNGGVAGRFVQASYAQCPRADYPEAAKREGREGKVMLLVIVDEEGRPKSSRVFESSGVASLDRAAVDNVQQRCRFHPARRGDKRVETAIKVPVEFRLADSKVR